VALVCRKIHNLIKTQKQGMQNLSMSNSEQNVVEEQREELLTDENNKTLSPKEKVSGNASAQPDSNA